MTLPRESALPWLLVIGVNVVTIATGAWKMVAWPYDWGVLAQLPERLADGTLYIHGPAYNFAWSPAAAWIIAVAIVPFGYHAWFVLHIVALALLRDRRLIAIGLLSLPLWIDAGLGNVMAFVFVSAVLSLRGSRGGQLAYLALFILIPRPIQLPLAMWLLWKQPSVRLPFAAMAAAGLVIVLGTGHLFDWPAAVVRMSATHAAGEANGGLTHWFGMAWLIVGIPLAVWFTAHRRVGLAGLAMTPYMFPQYLLFLLLEITERRQADRTPQVLYRRRDDVRPALAIPALSLRRPELVSVNASTNGPDIRR